MGQSLDKTRDYLNSVKEGLRSVLCGTWRYKLTHEKMLERRKAIYASDAYKLLPRWAASEIGGYFDALYDCQINQRLFWTHVLDGKRVLSHDKCLDGRHGEIDMGLSYHCYLVRIHGEVQMIPFREEERAAELASGRLKQDDLDAIKRRATDVVLDVMLAHRPNGTPYPVIFTAVPH